MHDHGDRHINLRFTWATIVPAGATCYQAGCDRHADYTLLCSYAEQKPFHFCELHAHELMAEIKANFGHELVMTDTSFELPAHNIGASS
ncbi:MAG: hypothetical protein ACJ8C4_00515 [Gemmataceae bacterium]